MPADRSKDDYFGISNGCKPVDGRTRARTRRSNMSSQAAAGTAMGGSRSKFRLPFSVPATAVAPIPPEPAAASSSGHQGVALQGPAAANLSANPAAALEPASADGLRGRGLQQAPASMPPLPVHSGSGDVQQQPTLAHHGEGNEVVNSSPYQRPIQYDAGNAFFPELPQGAHEHHRNGAAPGVSHTTVSQTSIASEHPATSFFDSRPNLMYQNSMSYRFDVDGTPIPERCARQDPRCSPMSSQAVERRQCPGYNPILGAESGSWSPLTRYASELEYEDSEQGNLLFEAPISATQSSSSTTSSSSVLAVTPPQDMHAFHSNLYAAHAPRTDEDLVTGDQQDGWADDKLTMNAYDPLGELDLFNWGP